MSSSSSPSSLSPTRGAMPTFLALPLEILTQTLSNLPYTSLLTCKLTCKHLANLVRASAELQYILAKAHASVEDSPSSSSSLLSTAYKLALLKSRERAWLYFDYSFKQRVDLPVPTTGLYDVTPNAYFLGCSANGNRRMTNALMYARLPSRQGQAVNWDKLDVGHLVVDFGTSVEEHDLIALVVYRNENTTQWLDIVLRRFSNGLEHPHAEKHSIPVCKVLPDLGPLSLSIEIAGENLVLCVDYLHTGGIGAVMFAFDWMRGVLKFKPTPISNTSLVFLTPTIFIQPDINQLTLDAYYLPPSTSPLCSKEKLLHPFKSLRLPQLKRGMDMMSISCRGDPSPRDEGSLCPPKAVGASGLIRLSTSQGDSADPSSTTPESSLSEEQPSSPSHSKQFTSTPHDAIIIFTLDVRAVFPAAAAERGGLAVADGDGDGVANGDGGAQSVAGGDGQGQGVGQGVADGDGDGDEDGEDEEGEIQILSYPLLVPRHRLLKIVEPALEGYLAILESEMKGKGKDIADEDEEEDDFDSVHNRNAEGLGGDKQSRDQTKTRRTHAPALRYARTHARNRLERMCWWSILEERERILAAGRSGAAGVATGTGGNTAGGEGGSTEGGMMALSDVMGYGGFLGSGEEGSDSDDEGEGDGEDDGEGDGSAGGDADAGNGDDDIGGEGAGGDEAGGVMPADWVDDYDSDSSDLAVEYMQAQLAVLRAGNVLNSASYSHSATASHSASSSHSSSNSEEEEAEEDEIEQTHDIWDHLHASLEATHRTEVTSLTAAAPSLSLPSSSPIHKFYTPYDQLHFIASYPGSGKICPLEWSEWGPANCRLFDFGEEMESSEFITVTSGCRYVRLCGAKGEGESGRRVRRNVEVMDFSQARVRAALEEDCVGSGSGEGKGKFFIVPESSPSVIDKPRSAFVGKVETRLPYISTGSSEKFEYESVLVDEERVIGMLYPDEDRSIEWRKSVFHPFEVVYFG